MGNNDSSGLYRFGDELGKGSYGVVYKAERRSDGKTVAIKTVKVEKLTPSLMNRTLDEVRLLASIDHPNVIGFESSFYNEAEKTLCIVTEYAEKGDLQRKIEEHRRTNRRIPESVIWKILLHVARGLKYLHQNRIIHRDMKTANVFESADGTFKIGDLNLSKIMSGTIAAKTRLGTPLYLSPEIWQNQSYDTQSDMWSLGVLIYQLAALKAPYHAATTKELRAKIFNARPKKVSHYSSLLTDIIDRLLTVDPMKRPNADEIVELAERVRHSYYNEPHIEERNESQIDLLKTIVLPECKHKWNSVLPKYRKLRSQSIQNKSMNSDSFRNEHSGEEAGSGQENMLNVSVVNQKDKRVGSVINGCKKYKPSNGRVRLLPLPPRSKDDQENRNPNHPEQVQLQACRQE